VRGFSIAVSEFAILHQMNRKRSDEESLAQSPRKLSCVSERIRKTFNVRVSSILKVNRPVTLTKGDAMRREINGTKIGSDEKTREKAVDAFHTNGSARRSLVKTAAKGAVGLVGLYALSKIPLSYEQTSSQVTEIDVGKLQVPVTFDGQVQKDEWYSDSIDYQSIGANILPGISHGSPPKFHFRTKYDEYTYQSIDIPAKKDSNAYVNLYFDTKSTRSWGAGADGVYALVLNPESGTWFEADKLPDMTRPIPGNAFKDFFKRGEDYDWRGFLGSSPLDSSDHLQFEFKFRTDLLTKNAIDNRINYRAEVVTAGGIERSSVDYIPMVFESQALPEFGAEDAVLLTSLGLGAAAAKLAKKNMSRRDFLGISALANIKKQLS
jgi:hypothetical protein